MTYKLPESLLSPDTKNKLDSISGIRSKLDGIAEQATKNDTDTNLKNRSNHTGAQAISTITGLQESLDLRYDASRLFSKGRDSGAGLINTRDGRSVQSEITNTKNILSSQAFAERSQVLFESTPPVVSIEYTGTQAERKENNRLIFDRATSNLYGDTTFAALTVGQTYTSANIPAPFAMANGSFSVEVLDKANGGVKLRVFRSSTGSQFFTLSDRNRTSPPPTPTLVRGYLAASAKIRIESITNFSVVAFGLFTNGTTTYSKAARVLPEDIGVIKYVNTDIDPYRSGATAFIANITANATDTTSSAEVVFWIWEPQVEDAYAAPNGQDADFSSFVSGSRTGRAQLIIPNTQFDILLMGERGGKWITGQNQTVDLTPDYGRSLIQSIRALPKQDRLLTVGEKNAFVESHFPYQWVDFTSRVSANSPSDTAWWQNDQKASWAPSIDPLYPSDIQIATNRNNVVKFKAVHGHRGYSGDSSDKQRSELASSQTLPTGTEFGIYDQFMIPSGQALNDPIAFNLLHQLHAGSQMAGSSPPYAMFFRYDPVTKIPYIRWILNHRPTTSTSGTVTQSILPINYNIDYDTWYEIIVRGKMSTTAGQGELNIWVNRELVVSGTDFSYGFNKTPGADSDDYLKLGIYRGQNSGPVLTNPFEVWHANFAFGSWTTMSTYFTNPEVPRV